MNSVFMSAVFDVVGSAWMGDLITPARCFRHAAASDDEAGWLALPACVSFVRRTAHSGLWCASAFLIKPLHPQQGPKRPRRDPGETLRREARGVRTGLSQRRADGPPPWVTQMGLARPDNLIGT